jgi:nucleoside-diphosphate-sugar epimerase
MALPYTRVLVLGGTGFLGSRIVRELCGRGVEARAYGSADVDLRRFESLKVLDDQIDADTVLIFASALTPDKGSTLEALHDNFTMAASVGRYLETRSIGLCVYISSDAVYPLRDNPVRESSPIEPANYYALAKYCGERILARQAEIKGLPLLNLRSTALYGPGDPHGSYGPNSFMRSLLKDRTVRLFGRGEELRDHLHVDDAARLTCDLIAARAAGTFNLATGRSQSFSDVVDVMRQVVPQSFEVEYLPRRAPVTHRHFDIARLFLQVPGFRFTSLEQGLSGYYHSGMQDP